MERAAQWWCHGVTSQYGPLLESRLRSLKLGLERKKGSRLYISGMSNQYMGWAETGTRTFRTRKRSRMIFQSSSSSSNLRSFNDLLPVMLSIAERYLRATFIMS